MLSDRTFDPKVAGSRPARPTSHDRTRADTKAGVSQRDVARNRGCTPRIPKSGGSDSRWRSGSPPRDRLAGQHRVNTTRSATSSFKVTRSGSSSRAIGEESRFDVVRPVWISVASVSTSTCSITTGPTVDVGPSPPDQAMHGTTHRRTAVLYRERVNGSNPSEGSLLPEPSTNGRFSLPLPTPALPIQEIERSATTCPTGSSHEPSRRWSVAAFVSVSGSRTRSGTVSAAEGASGSTVKAHGIAAT
jgi:hypothetical protein